jgi:hypothetical protein
MQMFESSTALILKYHGGGQSDLARDIHNITDEKSKSLFAERQAAEVQTDINNHYRKFEEQVKELEIEDEDIDCWNYKFMGLFSL